MSKPVSPIRRAELLAPFGVGAMLIARNGLGLVTAGLDHWFEREDGTSKNIDIQEYRVEEWRLKGLLKVDHFRLPPDFRRRRLGKDTPNTELTVPFLRFPRWNFCPICKLLVETALTSRDREVCPACSNGKNGKNPKFKTYVRQVPFVALCDQGHLQDFPWREWVHKKANPTCSAPMHLYATGGATLESQYVKCDCGASRTLAGITTAYPDGTTNLSKNLEPDGPEFICRGKRPWLCLEDGESCTSHLRGSLRSASNVYFAQIRSAIYLPRGNDIAPSELVALMEQIPLSGLIDMLNQLEKPVTPQILRQNHQSLLRKYSDAQVAAAINIIQSTTQNQQDVLIDEDKETSFRRSEFNILRSGLDESVLRAKPVNTRVYDQPLPDYFSKITLVEKLRETRVLEGFNRIFSDNNQDLDHHKKLLRRDPLPSDKDWLPANIIYGEGIYLELDENRLQAWLKSQELALKKRTKNLVTHYKEIQQSRHLKDRPLGSRLILLHTFSHLIMNRLVFECGYSSASLRERLYISGHPLAPMAGVLIYTAAGDSEGTMGGLVRMGKPGNLEPIIQHALENARWCSADPICMEIGGESGQGPDSCNLAACHNCALVPETACEEFNRFLDRGLVIGDPQNPDLGFFRDYF